MNVLSLCDGKSSGFTACELAGIKVDSYYSAEIDRYAIQVSDAIHPNQIRLGDVTKWRDWDIDWSSIDIIFCGFPCQAWSMAGKQMGDKDERGMLFWTMLDIMKHVRHYNPKADFLIENVKMKKEFEQYITHHTKQALGEVHKILINSALVSAQNRNRYYWTSFPVTQPEDRGIVLRDIIEYDHVDRDKAYCIDANYFKGGNTKSYFEKHCRQLDFTEPTVDGETFEQWYEKTKDHGGSLEEFQKMTVKCGRVVGRKINPETGKSDDYNPDLKIVQRFEARLDDKSGCLTTVQKDNQLVFVGLADDIKGYDSNRRVYDASGKAPTLLASSGGHKEPKVKIADGDRLEVNLTYRKLTPRECFRLQTVPEHYIDKILNSGELYSHSQNFYNELARLKVRGSKCKSVKSITVNSQSQAEKLDYAISTTLDSLGMELQKQLGSLSIKASLVPKVGASVIAKLQKDCVSSTTRHGNESTTSQPESVRFALKTSEADGVECVLDTLNQSKNMETQIRLTLTPEENSNLMGIKASNISKTQTVDGLIELSLRKLQEESCEEARLYITLMAINLITAKAIFSFANLEHNTYLCIDSLSQSQCNSLEVGISTLKMENIKPTSNSTLYKIAGNGWTDEVIAHILKCMENKQ